VRLVPYPGGEAPAPDERLVAELESALTDGAAGPEADSWRELRTDVRALAPAMSPELERRLHAELARNRRGGPAGASTGVTSAVPSSRVAGDQAEAVAEPAPDVEPAARRRRGAPSRWVGRLRASGRPALLGAGAVLVTVVVSLVVVVSQRHGTPVHSAPAPFGAVIRSGPAAVNAPRAASPNVGAASAPTHSTQALGVPQAAGGGAVSTPARVQQLAASITLGTTAGEVQSTADGVSRLAASVEGFVESSRVQVQQQGPSEATLRLRVPASRLAAALASIGRLAQVRAENQSLQDITDEYDSARRRLADANAERQALLRALAAATTEGQIASLHERLSQASRAIAQDRSALAAISRRASTAEVEVSVLGDAHASAEGLTLDRGLHDAGRVLLVALVVLLIAAAALVPLGLLLAVLAGAGRAWRRNRRERALDAG
jgi:hypothetical protein